MASTSGLMEYQERDTFLHTRLHPLTKMIVFLTVVFITGLWLDVRYLAFVLAAGLLLAYLSKTPKRWFIVMLVAMGLTWFPTLRTTVAQAKPEYFKVLDPAWAGTSILTINLPIVERLGLTYGSLYWLAGRLTRFAAVVTWAMVFINTTSMSEIANTLYALKVPPSMVFVFQITYKFIPYMASILNQISDAQKLRGWNLRTWNIAKLVRRSLPMANPLIRRTAMIVDQMTTATQIRGFGSGSVTPLRDLTLEPLDKAIIGFFVGGFVLAILALAFFQAGLI
ncbi:MAG: energy-coupling factor transporter transmembrane component T [Anaerolineales bacterium]|jgi:energy-coupling factor transport system permease protein